MAWCRQCKSCATIRSYYRAPPATEGIPMKIRSPRHHALPLLLATALAPLAASAQDVDITYQSFTLDNGLRGVVHEAHKTPIVPVTVWYHAGSKSAQQANTGMADRRSVEYGKSETVRVDHEGRRFVK